MNTRNVSALLAAAVLTACAAAPPPRTSAPPPPPVNLTKVFFYPSQGQSEAQQDRDRYDCHVWAVRQSGFDPTLRIPSPERSAVVPARPPGHTVGTAAAVGAIIGAATSRPGDAAEGAVVGAVAGTLVGAVAASAEADSARAVAARQDSRDADRYERDSAGYRRAMSACLEGRGYSVR